MATFICFLKKHFVDSSKSSAADLPEVQEILCLEVELAGVDLELARRVDRVVKLEPVLRGHFGAGGCGLKRFRGKQ